jgi:hypothetical protein
MESVRSSVTTPTPTNHGLSYLGMSSFADILIQLTCLSDYQDFAPQLVNKNPPIAAYRFSPALSNSPGIPGTPLSSLYSSDILPTPHSQHQAASRSPLMNNLSAMTRYRHSQDSICFCDNQPWRFFYGFAFTIETLYRDLQCSLLTQFLSDVIHNRPGTLPNHHILILLWCSQHYRVPNVT